MKPLRFYEHFACAYGTIWLLMLLVALVTQSKIDAGLFGMIGFPIMALIYAFVRRAGESGRKADDGMEELRRRIAEMEARSGQNE